MAAQAGAQRKESAASAPAAGASTAAPSTAPPIVHSVIGSSGKPLDPQTRADLEPKFGQDFSGVRIHTDARAAESARAVNALAYTVGNNIVFNEGRYNPNSSDGRHLLAHELTHTVQQGAVRPSGDLPIGDTAAPEEREADDVARGVTSARAGSSGLSVRRAVLQKEDADGQTPQPDAGAATSASGKDAAKSDGIGPDEVYAYADSVLGKGWRERLMGQQDPGAEGQANQAADSVSAGGTAPEVASMRGGPELQMVHPAVIVGAAALAIVACAFPFFLYALDNYSSKGDKWMHCWASCKIGTYCGLPGIAQVVSVLVGATKEVVDALCDAAGRKCSAEWNDFVADLDGIWCTIRHPLTTCVDCCDNTALPK